MSPQLVGKTAFITGGADGIGRETVREFASQGARVISMDVDEKGNAQTASLAKNHGGFCEPLRGDVSVEADVQRAFRQAGNVDILINNAACWGGDGFLHELSEKDWDRIQAVTLKGVFLCSREALRGMMARRGGVIINISSVNALTGITLSAYTAAKGGVVSLTRVLTQQYGGYGIRVNTICPGTIMTESSRRFYDERPGMEADLRSLYPASSFGTPSDVAKCALYLASEEARFINGSIIVIDGGATAVHRIPSAVPTQGK